MSKGWLEPNEWKRVQAVIPIVCVDILPVRYPGSCEDAQTILDVGLIKRDTPHEGKKWCLIGGRLLHEETLGEAITRQLHTTLGATIHFVARTDQQPLYVAQYMPTERLDLPVDTRQHAIGLTYCVEIEGTPIPQGEADAFEWFALSALPQVEAFGFHQDRVVTACLSLLLAAREIATK